MNSPRIASLTLLFSVACSKPGDHAISAVQTAPITGPNATFTPVVDANVPRAPDVTFTLSDGFRLSLASLRGKVVALVVCPAVDAPGCRRESQGLANHWRELEAHYVTAIGLVPDDTEQYRAAVNQREVPFDFVADVDGQSAHAFGISAHEADPTVIVVGRDGTIQAVWRTADPDTHVREMLATAMH